MATLFGSPAFTGPLSMAQLYFLSSPHRWITLVLVFCDPDRFWKEPRRFGSIGAGLLTLGLTLAWLGTQWKEATDSLMFLMMLDLG